MNLSIAMIFLHFFIIIDFGHCHWIIGDVFYSNVCEKNRTSLKMVEKIQQDVFCESTAGQNSERKHLLEKMKKKKDIEHVSLKFSPILLEVMEQEEVLRVSGIIQMEWVNDFIKWTPSAYDSIDKFELNNNYDFTIWYPKVVKDYDESKKIVNTRFLDQMDEHDSKPATVHSNGLITLQYKSKIFAPCKYDPESWPFEEWTCDFMLANSLDKTVLLNPFDPQTDVDLTGMKFNHAWRVKSDPPFFLEKHDASSIQLFITIERYLSHHQSIFIYPGVALLLLSLISFWFTNRICCRLMVNMLTTLVQLILLLRMITLIKNKSGSHGIALLNFYIDSVYVSLSGILFALVNDMLISTIIDPPQYMIQMINTAVAMPGVGPMLAFFINEENTRVSTMKYGDLSMTTDIVEETNQKWRIISSFFDKFAFIIIVLYVLFSYGLKLLL